MFSRRLGHLCGINLDDIMAGVARLFTQAPGYYLAWPALAMLVGALVGMGSAKTAAKLAVVPRTGAGLTGLLTAPFVHANFAHFAANLPPFLVLGALVLRRNEARFVPVGLAIAGLQGGLLWLFGRKAAHVGMSGVIFGLFSWLVAVAWFTRTTSDLLVAGGVILVYGGMLAGIAPVRDGSSWDGHLFGLLAGVGTAWVQYRGW